MSEQTKSIIKAVAALAAEVVLIVNMVLQAMGKPAVEIGTEQVSMAVNAVLTAVMTLYCWWKNQNITKDAVMGQEIINGLKSGDIDEVVIEDEDE